MEVLRVLAVMFSNRWTGWAPIAAVRASCVDAACNAVLATFGKGKRQTCRPQVLIACQSNAACTASSADVVIYLHLLLCTQVKALQVGSAVWSLAGLCLAKATAASVLQRAVSP